MRPGGGKNKGSDYERIIGAKISLWISKGERKDLLCRTVLSGGQFTMSSSGNAGDLMGQHVLAIPFCSKVVVECKSWKDLQIIKFLNREGELYKAMLKVQEEAKKVGKIWWLTVKQNHGPDLLFMSVQQNYNVGIIPSFSHTIFSGTVYMFKLDEFLKEMPHDQYTSNKRLPIH